MAKKLRFFVSSIMVLLGISMLQKVWGADDSYDVIERDYSGAITYSSGTFGSYKDGTTLSTQPSRPQKPRSQAVLNYDKTNFVPEKVLKKIILGQDGREHIQDTTAWPYSIHAHLNMVFNGNDYGGSGVMIGPHHLLTCGHCVYDYNEKFFFQEISVYPALNESMAPFNKVRVTKAYLFKEWQDQGDERFDMALLLLDQPVGDYVGWAGLLSIDDVSISQETVSITGYPGDKGFKQMWGMSHKIMTVMPEQFNYIIDTYGGQSGSAVWINKWGMPMVLGVHTLGSNQGNSGVRISERKFTKIFDIITKTYNINLDVNILNIATPPKFLSPSGNMSSLIVIYDLRASIIDELFTYYEETRKYETFHLCRIAKEIAIAFNEINSMITHKGDPVLGENRKRSKRERQLKEISQACYSAATNKKARGITGYQFAHFCSQEDRYRDLLTKELQESIKEELEGVMKMYQDINGKSHPRWEEFLKKLCLKF